MFFREDGEDAFRQLERTASLTIAKLEGTVIATGGRLMLDEGNAAALMANGRVFCLTAEPEEIVARVREGGETAVAQYAQSRRQNPGITGPAPRRLRPFSPNRYHRQNSGAGGARNYERSAQWIAYMVFHALRSVVSKRKQMKAQYQTLPVTHPTGAYNVIVGQNLLTNLLELAHIDGPFIVVTDTNVGPLHAHKIEGALAVVTVPAGEENKTLDAVRHIYDQLFAAGLDRKGTLVALGGGVVGDMTGFVAASYMRGVDFVQCPTTLLAMVDASVGGKTGVDMPQGKNLIGAFQTANGRSRRPGHVANLAASRIRLWYG
ncbi:MAG: hypothetical protein M5U14_19770 [Acidimicrobiia bacterium]|nr:hypothetical protein [Acidimicrobiia bacterium]